MDYVIPADLALETGQEQDTTGRWQRWLDQAHAAVYGAVRDLDERVEAGRILPATVEQVICELVIGRINNPLGQRSNTVTRSEGPFSETRSQTYAEEAAGPMALSQRQLRLLGVGAGAFTIRPAGRR